MKLKIKTTIEGIIGVHQLLDQVFNSPVSSMESIMIKSIAEDMLDKYLKHLRTHRDAGLFDQKKQYKLDLKPHEACVLFTIISAGIDTVPFDDLTKVKIRKIRDAIHQTLHIQ